MQKRGRSVVLVDRRGAAEETSFGNAGLMKMQVIDALGQRTEINFTGWKRNPSFPGNTFRYTPPRGVDVIGEG